ncbi:MAG: hypothetical protein HY273_11690 [Gammaproteobacteria bacterium]|nr:hypothetical protein [Gammaproteobacteria bacterium]
MSEKDSKSITPPARELTGHEKQQLHFWLRATPAQRLAWLEEMLEFASTVCVLPKVGREKM